MNSKDPSSKVALCALSLSFCVAACSRDAPVREPDGTMTPASAEQADGSRHASSEPTSEIIVEESIRVSCDLPNDRETAPRFDFDEAELRPRGKGILDGVALCLREGAMQGDAVTIVGHADPRGSEAYNQQLGRRRAEAARDYLTGQGLSSDRIHVLSRGESTATGTDESGWSTDRRVEVRRGKITQ